MTYDNRRSSLSPQTRFSFFFCSYWEVRLFFFLCVPDICFLSRWESAGFLKVPWCKILQSKPDEVSHFRENQNLIAWTFFFFLFFFCCCLQKLPETFLYFHLFRFISNWKFPKVFQVLPGDETSCLASLMCHLSLFYHFNVSCFTFSLYWLAIKSVLIFILLWPRELVLLLELILHSVMWPAVTAALL